MLTRIFGVTSLVALVAIIAWINPGSVLVAALVTLPYLLLLMVIHYQCIHLIQRLIEDYPKSITPHPVQSPVANHPEIVKGLVL